MLGSLGLPGSVAAAAVSAEDIGAGLRNIDRTVTDSFSPVFAGCSNKSLRKPDARQLPTTLGGQVVKSKPTAMAKNPNPIDAKKIGMIWRTVAPCPET